MIDLKAECPHTWAALTARFNLVTFMAFSKKDKEKMLQTLLESAYTEGKCDGTRETIDCLDNARKR